MNNPFKIPILPSISCFHKMLLPLLIASFLIPSSSSLNSDGLSLLALKAAIDSDPSGALRSWSDSDSTPCRWHGIGCDGGRVTSLSLPNKGLTGYIPSELGLLDSLQQLSLAHNNFSKLIPAHLFNATGLFSLDLSHNSLSGPIPDQITTLMNLTHLDLSSNLLNGSLPESLSDLISLTGTLNMSYNLFSGEVPESYGHFPVIVSLDLRHNNLTGKIPQVGSLVNQGPTAFSGNPSLCGFPLDSPCPEAQNPGAITNTEDPRNPQDPNPSLPNVPQREKENGGSMAVPLISGVFAVVGVVSLSVWLFQRKKGSDEGKMEKQNPDVVDVVAEEIEGQKGKFVVIDEGFNMELEDLLRASAYVVGKGRSGIVYKVVAGRRSGAPAAVVAVRRLSEGNTTWRLKEFESEVEAIGRVHHPNIVRLRAYYFANDEKLLVSDFIGNGSLYTALHGGPSDSSLSPLPWAARLKIAQGTARGLMYIHECTPRKYVHGNIKSTKILLNDDLQPYISGFGLTRLVSGTSKLTISASKKQNSNQAFITSTTGSRILSPSTFYVAPEGRVPGSKFTQKCDVYSFGIVLMEILTGRQPDSGSEDDGKGLESQVRKVFREERPLSEIIDPNLLHEVHAKKQVIAAFHIALNCAEIDPELRPRMRTVSESLDRIKSQ